MKDTSYISNPLNSPATILNLAAIREDFPILKQHINGHPLAYLDNAATTQRPKCVIDRITEFYTTCNANIHRGLHQLSMQATDAFEASREAIAHYINAKSSQEIVFVRGTTEAINLVANSYGMQHITAGDEIIISEMEHHANIVPWQLLCQRTGAKLKIIPFDDLGELCITTLNTLFGPKTKLLALVHVSNALGTINPVAEIIELAHRHNVPVLIDGTQAGPHLAIDVQALDCDFYTLSAHKMYGPTGIGALYAKQHILQSMPPYQGGGEMITYVTFEKTEFAAAPARFEAGTLPIASAIAWAKSLSYLQHIGLEAIQAHEQALLNYASKQASQMSDMTIYGQAAQKISLLAFNIEGIHAHDIGTICDQYGVAIRTGHHCAMPVIQHFKIAATARASFAFYNTFAEVDQLFFALHKAREIFH